MLVDELQGDETAPLLVLRLWAHCQVKKTHRLGRVSAAALKSICRYKGAHEALWLAMQNSGFIEVKNEQLDVHEWSVYNAGLITSWKNGAKGGRPRKPTGNPQVTHGQPASNPLETDKRGLDKRREERNGSDHPNPSAQPTNEDTIYAAYPRKQGKSDAIKAIRRVLTRKPFQELLDSTNAFAEAVRAWPAADLQFVPHPSTWYNRGSYDDDRSTWVRKPTDTGKRAAFA